MACTTCPARRAAGRAITGKHRARKPRADEAHAKHRATPAIAGKAGLLDAAPPTHRGLDPGLLAILAGAAGLWIYFLLHTRIRLEDALITYRYAENLAGGNGFVFNPGERVLGTTTPLFALILGGFGALFGTASIPMVSNALMLAAGLATAWLLHDVVLRGTDSRSAAFAAAGLWVASPDTLWTTVGGMETPLVILLMIAGLNLALRDRWSMAGVAAGLLVLTRADGLLWAVLLLALGIPRLRARTWRPVVAGLAVVIPWVVFAWRYFGSPVPHSILAKQEIGPGAGSVNYLSWMLDSLGFTFFADRTPVEFALWLPLVLLGSAAVWLKAPAHRGLRLLAVFPPLFAAALAWGQAPWFPWYMVPVTWCGVVLGVLGAREARPMLEAHVRASSWPRATVPVVTAFCGLVLALGLVLRDVGTLSYWRDFQENEDATRARIGAWIAAHTRADAVVAMEAIGYQGALSKRRVVDLAGVISPDVVRIHRQTHSNAQTFARILGDYRPEVVVLRTFEFEQNQSMNGGLLFESLQARSDFLAGYERVFQVDAPHPGIWGGGSSITVWHRKG